MLKKLFRYIIKKICGKKKQHEYSDDEYVNLSLDHPPDEENPVVSLTFPLHKSVLISGNYKKKKEIGAQINKTLIKKNTKKINFPIAKSVTVKKKSCKVKPRKNNKIRKERG